MELVKFLRARLAEDEARARAALSAQVRVNAGPVESETGLPSVLEVEAVDRWHAPPASDVIGEYEASVQMPGGAIRVSSAVPDISARDCAEHIALHDPARVLAEVESKRRLLDEIVPKVESYWNAVSSEWGCEYDDPDGEDVLKLLALPYASHKDYREEWRPQSTNLV